MYIALAQFSVSSKTSSKCNKNNFIILKNSNYEGYSADVIIL